jgi:lipopolysaccharide cholinephosphotransferase
MTLNKIETRNGVLEFKVKDFSGPPKYLNLDVAKNNLLDLKEVMDESGVKFGLIYGTLLGAYREKNFIKHDYDTDLYVLEEVKQDLLDALPKLINIGFEVCRYDGLLLSISRDEEYIDFYFFRKSNFFYRKNSLGLSAKAKYLENTVDYNFLGKPFQIPQNVESFLVYLYGPTWNTPIENDQSKSHHWYIKTREYIRNDIAFIFPLLSFVKRIINKIKI